MFVDIILQLKKKTNRPNIISEDIFPMLPRARVYYFRELNCSNVDTTWNFNRIINNLNAITVLIYQELTTDIISEPN